VGGIGVIPRGVSNLEGLPEHRGVLERAVAHFQDDDRVVALILGGSLARGAPDFYSDVDLYIVARDDDFDAVFAERDTAAEAAGNPLFRFVVNPVPGGSTDQIAVYRGPVKLDLMYYRESDLSSGWKWGGCSVLKDTSGAGIVVSRSAGLAHPPPPPEALRDLDQRFWTWCWYVFGKIVRGELWEALDGIHNIRSSALLPLLAWRDGLPHEGHRRLEYKLNPETASRLASTIPELRADALYEALWTAVGLHRDLRTEVFDRYGCAFDPAPGEIIRCEINRRWTDRLS